MHHTWAIGDIHGHAKHLEALLEKLPLQSEDRIVFLGDLIDRGPESHRVLEILHALKRAHKVILIRGNHEVMMLEARQDRAAIMRWLQNGGDATLDAYQAKTLDAIPAPDWELIESTKPYHEEDIAIYLHASFDPLLNMEHQSESDLFWRFCTNPAPHCSGKFVVCGHTLQADSQPRLWKGVLCIDTLNPPKSDWLTAVNVERQTYWQVNRIGELRTEPFSALKV